MDRKSYDDNTYWRQKHFDLCVELGQINNGLMDQVVSLQNENKRLKRENWNLKKTKGRRK